MKQFRIERVKVVSAMMLDENGNPTGELCDIVDRSACLLDSELEGRKLLAQQTDADGGAQWTIDSITCP